MKELGSVNACRGLDDVSGEEGGAYVGRWEATMEALDDFSTGTLLLSFALYTEAEDHTLDMKSAGAKQDIPHMGREEVE